MLTWRSGRRQRFERLLPTPAKEHRESLIVDFVGAQSIQPAGIVRGESEAEQGPANRK